MANFNKVILMGNLTRDPELRYSNSGKAIGKIRIAVNREWKDKSGESKKETSFFDCTSFGKAAELISQYTEKGSPLLIDGRLKQESWETDQGEKRSKIVVIIENFQFVGGRKSDQ
jgi:single-strand DNA-binding protein